MNGEDRKFFEKLLEVHVTYLTQKIDSVNFNIGKRTESLEKKFDENFPSLKKKVDSHSRYIRSRRRRIRIAMSTLLTFLVGASCIIFREAILSLF